MCPAGPPGPSTVTLRPTRTSSQALLCHLAFRLAGRPAARQAAAQAVGPPPQPPGPRNRLVVQQAAHAAAALGQPGERRASQEDRAKGGRRPWWCLRADKRTHLALVAVQPFLRGPPLSPRPSTPFHAPRRPPPCTRLCRRAHLPPSVPVHTPHAALPSHHPHHLSPQTFFANERTFLSWLHMAVTIGSIATALLGFSGSSKADPGVRARSWVGSRSRPCVRSCSAACVGALVRCPGAPAPRCQTVGVHRPAAACVCRRQPALPACLLLEEVPRLRALPFRSPRLVPAPAPAYRHTGWSGSRGVYRVHPAAGGHPDVRLRGEWSACRAAPRCACCAVLRCAVLCAGSACSWGARRLLPTGVPQVLLLPVEPL